MLSCTSIKSGEGSADNALRSCFKMRMRVALTVYCFPLVMFQGALRDCLVRAPAKAYTFIPYVRAACVCAADASFVTLSSDASSCSDMPHCRELTEAECEDEAASALGQNWGNNAFGEIWGGFAHWSTYSGASGTNTNPSKCYISRGSHFNNYIDTLRWNTNTGQSCNLTGLCVCSCGGCRQVHAAHTCCRLTPPCARCMCAECASGSYLQHASSTEVCNLVSACIEIECRHGADCMSGD